MTVSADKRLDSFIGEDWRSALETRLDELGIQYSTTQEGQTVKYEMKKTYTSVDSMKSEVGQLDGMKLKLEEQKHFWYTKYAFTGQLDLDGFDPGLTQKIRSVELPTLLKQLVLKQLSLNVVLNLPTDSFGMQNADRVEGKTLTWNLNLLNPEPIQVEFYAPNIKNIVLVSSAGVLAVIAIAVFLLKRRGKAA
ncbi:DUF3153 domain-containing protein [Paenibacillus sp. HN-1]|nr:hypothetical protein [Paenibacillus sp. CGMCC 1.18879]MBY9079944.1 DUF3153 domain-containing protein [Paenibacillus sp. CGMCC 1.18879]MBY9084586.1 DUF3153 domain-containing protein [Paenibacillus sinensis]